MQKQVFVALSWVRGLKRQGRAKEEKLPGRTLMSAWIETCTGRACCILAIVALSWVRGLKRLGDRNPAWYRLSHSHECVDWNPYLSLGLERGKGRTLMSAWIETSVTSFSRIAKACRTLMSAWIETDPHGSFPCNPAVALSWVRGFRCRRLNDLISLEWEGAVGYNAH